MKDDIWRKIIEGLKEFEDKHRTRPKKMYLTIEDEPSILEMLPKTLAEKAFTEGVRVAVPRILGFEAVYGADKFGFE